MSKHIQYYLLCLDLAVFTWTVLGLGKTRHSPLLTLGVADGSRPARPDPTLLEISGSGFGLIGFGS